MIHDWYSNIHFEYVPLQGFVFEEIKIPKKFEPSTIKIEISSDYLNQLKEDLELEWIEKQKGSKKLNVAGGGEQLDVSKHKTNSNPQIRETLEMLALGKTFKKNQNEKKYWDGTPLLKNLIINNFSNIEKNKYDWMPQEIYFFVDTSGSVHYLSQLIISLIISTVNSPKIKVFSGSESHPNKDERTGQVILHHRDRFLHTGFNRANNFFKFKRGAKCVFWGDLQGTGIVVNELKQSLRNFDCIWLNPSDVVIGTLDETLKCKQVMPVYMGMNSERQIINQIKKII